MHEAIGAKFSAVPPYIIAYQLTKHEPKLSTGFGSMRYFRDDKFFMKHPVDLSQRHQSNVRSHFELVYKLVVQLLRISSQMGPKMASLELP